MRPPILPFTTQLERSRRRKIMGVVWGLLGTVVLVATAHASGPYGRAIRGPAMLGLCVCVYRLIAPPKLFCPTCTGRADKLHRYCPVCGTDGLEHKPLAAPHCASCDRTLARWWIRDYKIRHCTHCGVELSAEGV